MSAPDLPARAGVVVVGGGVIGTSAAYHLARAGVPGVVLLERDALGSGSTSKAAGGVRASFSNPANIALGLRGLEVYARFAQDPGQDIDFRRDGYLYLLSDREHVELFTESVAVQNAYGVPSRLVDPAQAQRLSPLISPDGLLAAAWSPQDGRATPESVVLGYAAAARRAGALVVPHCAVTGIESSGGTITAVLTDAGRIATGTVVCAAGAWSRALGAMVGVDVPVVPVRRQIAVTEPVPDLPARSPSLTIDFPSSFYFHLEGRGLLFGWSDPDEPEGFQLRFDLEDWLLRVGEIASRRAPRVVEPGIRTGWAGLYEVTPDRNQILGRHPEVDGLVLATGFSGHGFLMGPASGEIVRDLVLGQEPGYDLRPFAPGRFAGGRRAVAEVNIV